MLAREPERVDERKRQADGCRERIQEPCICVGGRDRVGAEQGDSEEDRQRDCEPFAEGTDRISLR